MKDQPADFYFPLFQHLSQEHGLTCTESELQAIIQTVQDMNTIDRPKPTPEPVWRPSDREEIIAALWFIVAFTVLVARCPVWTFVPPFTLGGLALIECVILSRRQLC